MPRNYLKLLSRALLCVGFLGGLHHILAQPTNAPAGGGSVLPGLPGVGAPGGGLPGMGGITPAPPIDPNTGMPLTNQPPPVAPVGGGGPVSTNQAPQQANNLVLLAEAMAVVQATARLIEAEAQGKFSDEIKLDKWGKKIRQTRQQHNLGVLYLNGVGVPLDFQSAYKWFKSAAEDGLPEAQLNVGIALQSGMGVKKDMVGAYKYYSLAAAQGLPNAAQARDNLAQFLTRFQIQAGQRMAYGFMKRYKAKLKYIEERKAAERELFEALGRTPAGPN